MSETQTLQSFLETPLVESMALTSREDSVPTSDRNGTPWLLIASASHFHAIDAHTVEAIIVLTDIAPIPFVSAKGLVGFINFRGQAIPVISLQPDFRWESVTNSFRLVIARDAANILTALLVSQVFATIRAVPSVGFEDPTLQVIRHGGQVFVVNETDHGGSKE